MSTELSENDVEELAKKSKERGHGCSSKSQPAVGFATDLRRSKPTLRELSDDEIEDAFKAFWKDKPLTPSERNAGIPPRTERKAAKAEHLKRAVLWAVRAFLYAERSGRNEGFNHEIKCATSRRLELRDELLESARRMKETHKPNEFSAPVCWREVSGLYHDVEPADRNWLARKLHKALLLEAIQILEKRGDIVWYNGTWTFQATPAHRYRLQLEKRDRRSRIAA